MVSVTLMDSPDAWFSDPSASSPSDQTSSHAETEGTRCAQKILIVEDELLVAWHLESILIDLGFDVCGIYSSGESVLADISELVPQVILMDINLGAGMDGVATAKRIRENSTTPIIFVTAYGDSATKERVQEAVPGSQIVPKPVEPIRLKDALDIALGTTAN